MVPKFVFGMIHGMVVGVLSTVFPDLVHISQYPDASAVEVLDSSSGSPHWKVLFSRAVNDWVIEVVSELFGLLYATQLGQHVSDKMVWIHSGNKQFSVRSLYKLFRPNGIYSFPCSVFGRLRYLQRWRSLAGLLL